MKSKFFLCLLLIAAMLVFAGCSDNSTAGNLEDDARDMVNDVGHGIERMTDDVLGDTVTKDGINNASSASIDSAY